MSNQEIENFEVNKDEPTEELNEKLDTDLLAHYFCESFPEINEDDI